MSTQEEIDKNIAVVQSSVIKACEKVGRNPKEITLVAVSKTQPIEKIQIAYDAGITNFGENYIQEALPKIANAQELPIVWHFIGHLQSNKVSKIIPHVQYIHTIDSLHVAEEINKQAKKYGIRPTVFLQMNISGERTKNGLEPSEVKDVAKKVAALPHIHLNGLMTIAPVTTNQEEVRPLFKKLQLLRDMLRNEIPTSNFSHLSMGMTNDYSVAIEEGATIIRIGRAIFGER